VRKDEQKTVKLCSTLREKIRNLYVQGIESEGGERILFSLDKLAEDHSVGKSTLYRYAKNENWKFQKDQFQESYLQKLDNQRAKELVTESKKFDTKTINISKQLLNEIGRFIIKSEADDELTPPMMNQLAEATYKVQKVAKLAMGEATENMSLNAKVSDTETFREALGMLDEIARAKSKVNDSAIH